MLTHVTRVQLAMVSRLLLLARSASQVPASEAAVSAMKSCGTQFREVTDGSRSAHAACSVQFLHNMNKDDDRASVVCQHSMAA